MHHTLSLVISMTLLGCALDAHDAPANDDPEGGGKADDAAQCASPQWELEIIADGNVGRDTTYRIDRSGVEHVLYRDEAAGTMAYATRTQPEGAWEHLPIPCRSVERNSNLAIADDGTAFVICTSPTEASPNHSGVVLERPRGASEWKRTELPAVFTDVSARGRQAPVGGAVSIAPNATVRVLTHVRRFPRSDERDYDWSRVTVWTKTDTGFVATRQLDYARSSQDGWRDASLGFCTTDDAAIVSGPYLQRSGTQTWATELKIPTSGTAQPSLTTLVYYDERGFVNSSGGDAACALDARGRAYHTSYDVSNGHVSLVRKGAGDAIPVFLDSGLWPDVKTAGASVYLSYNQDQSLRLYSRVGGTDAVTEIDGDGVGQHSSLAIAPDGLPRIAYYDQAEAQLKLATAHCP